jgi:hypothetical protein
LLRSRFSFAHHLAHRRQVLRGHVLQRLLQALEVVAEHLLPQVVYQVVEGLAGVLVHELVVEELLELAAVQAAASRGNPLASIAYSRSRISGARPAPTPPAAAGRARRALLDDLFEALGNAPDWRLHVVTGELLLAFLAQAIDQVAQACRRRRPVGGRRSSWAVEGAAEVGFFEEVVGDQVQDLVRVEQVDLLVPSHSSSGSA